MKRIQIWLLLTGLCSVLQAGPLTGTITGASSSGLSYSVNLSNGTHQIEFTPFGSGPVMPGQCTTSTCTTIAPSVAAYNLSFGTVTLDGNVVGYPTSVVFTFQPWTGGTAVNNNSLTPQGFVDYRYTLTGASTTFTGRVEVWTNDPVPVCVWCESFTGTAVVDGRMSNVIQFSNFSSSVTYSVTGQSTVPEPGTWAGMLLGGAFAGVMARRRASKR